MKNFVLLLFLTVGLVANVQAQKASAPAKVLDLPTAAFIKKVQLVKSPQLLDVRSPEEWAKGKIASSLCVTYNDPEFAKKVAGLDKQKPVFVYCAGGGRSPIAAKALAGLGFKEIYNCDDGGYGDLQAAGIK